MSAVTACARFSTWLSLRASGRSVPPTIFSPDKSVPAIDPFAPPACTECGAACTHIASLDGEEHALCAACAHARRMQWKGVADMSFVLALPEIVELDANSLVCVASAVTQECDGSQCSGDSQLGAWIMDTLCNMDFAFGVEHVMPEDETSFFTRICTDNAFLSDENLDAMLVPCFLRTESAERGKFVLRLATTPPDAEAETIPAVCITVVEDTDSACNDLPRFHAFASFTTLAALNESLRLAVNEKQAEAETRCVAKEWRDANVAIYWTTEFGHVMHMRVASVASFVKLCVEC